MKNIFVIAICTLFFMPAIFAQDIECDINLNLESLTTTEARDNLSDFVQQLKQYINSYRWSKEDGVSDKVKCSFTISIQGSVGDHHYIAQASIVSQRPIYKAGRNTAVVRILDDKWEFDYIRNQSLIHSDSQFDPLLSFVDYYINLILGYDADTYKLYGGTSYFQKAMETVNLARGATAEAKGWEPSGQGIFSRAQLIDELINPKFQDVRRAVHTYHRRGLDSLFSDQLTPYKRIISALDKIRKLREKINQPSLSIRTFFDTKYLEIAETFAGSSDLTVFNRISKIDPAHQKTYDEYAAKQK
jgi:hypothetical protein